MTKYPHSTYFFSLSPHSLIMNPKLSLASHVMDKKRLESLMLRDKPVVPPDSVIRTFTHLKGDKVDLVLTQDGEGLCQGSFVIRRGEWAKFFLDTWFDPLYRSYNFQKAEAHALVRSPPPPPFSSLLFSSHLMSSHPTTAYLLAPPLFFVLSLTSFLPTLGTRGPMAPDHPDQARPRAPTPHQLLRRRHPIPRRQGRHVQRRRIHRPARRLRARPGQVLREGV